ncbi:MAG TPA: multicopper oxidase family protein [Gemmatimonadales bacterium]|nr:multicopper oxidase family protein [Gemmatimonadales bacterium]
MLLPLLLALLSADPDCPRLQASGASADLYCIQLLPSPGLEAAGTAELRWVPGPFTVGVTAEGVHRWTLRLTLSALPSQLLRGRKAGFVAWAVSPAMSPMVRLGVVREGESEVGPIAFDRFHVLVSAESDTTVSAPRGRIVLRGESASNRLRPADNYQFFLGAAGAPAARPGTGHHEHGNAGDGWDGVPMFPGLDMLPSEMALRPGERPWLPAADAGAPRAVPSRPVRLRTGDTLTLVAGPVRRTVAGRDYTMLGFNGQYPGPLIQAERGAEVVVRLENRLTLPTTVHWHGVRLDHRFDGVPTEAIPAVEPGASFTYQLRFPDAGIFWYHPHVREDIQQDLGLYGNIFVPPRDEGPARRQEFLILDDLLVGDSGLVPYGEATPTHAAMGRFGNVMLVNGETAWRGGARPGEVVRFFLTNVANTRTFNLSFGPGTRLVLVGSDLGSYARPVPVESVVIAPAERYVVDVTFGAAGQATLVNRVRAIDHLYGRFFGVTDTLGAVDVAGAPVTGGAPAPAASAEAAALDSLVAAHAGREPQRSLELKATFENIPFLTEQLMRLDSAYFNPVEWEGTMPTMNWATTGAQARWLLEEPATGRRNMEIEWRFRRGELVRLRLVGARNTLHGMHHPIHLHGQRFLVLAVNGRRNENPVWKDTVLVPAGGSIDLLADMSNPGTWMLHCHIAEHLQSHMMMNLEVEE